MTNPAIERFYESMQGVKQRAQHGIEAIEMEISRKEVELSELRNALGEAQKILYVLDPDKRPKRQQRQRDRSKIPVSDKKIEALKGWLDNTIATDQTFSGPEILASESFDLMSEPTLRAALDILHERGLVTLDSVGDGNGKGGRRKNYRMVRA